MKILIVSQYYWPESFIITGLAEALAQRDHEVSVLTGFPNYPTGKFLAGYTPWRGIKREQKGGVRIIRVPIWPRGRGFVGLALNYVSFVLSGVISALFLDFKNVDVIFCYAPSPATSCLVAVFLKWKTGQKLLFWIQDLWPESISAVGVSSERLVNATFGRLIKFIYKNCDKILIPSIGFRQSIIARAGEAEKIELVPNWADPFPPSKATPSWVTSLPTGFRVGFAGNLGKAQNLSHLITTAEILKSRGDIKWIVVGDGSEKNWLESELKKRNLENDIFVLGRKPYEEMLPFFESCDVLYVSLSAQPIFSLTIPSKVQAYMSAAKPLLGSLRGEGKVLIETAQCGLVSDPLDAVALADNILKFLSWSPEERAQLGQNGKLYFLKNFEKKLVIDSIEKLFLRQR